MVIILVLSARPLMRSGMVSLSEAQAVRCGNKPEGSNVNRPLPAQAWSAKGEIELA